MKQIHCSICIFSFIPYNFQPTKSTHARMRRKEKVASFYVMLVGLAGSTLHPERVVKFARNLLLLFWGSIVSFATFSFSSQGWWVVVFRRLVCFHTFKSFVTFLLLSPPSQTEYLYVMYICLCVKENSESFSF